MRISTLFKFLIGDREAILTIANTRHAIWIALLFVITGGLARNYDKEPLLHEPKHVFGPLVVSGLIGTGLFLILYGAVRARHVKDTVGWGDIGAPSFLRAFLIFITLYWMTAPMAWLYGIPTERMTDIVTATELNLWTLAFVSLWRVMLMARVASVIFGGSFMIMFLLVSAFSNVVVAVVLIATPFPVINIMGGIELSESEQLISGITTEIAMLSVITIPVLLLTSLCAVGFIKSSWQVPHLPSNERPRMGRSVTALAFGSLVFWLAPLPLTQPAQSLRYHTEAALKRGDIERGIAMMSEHGLEAYPPHWDPPPRRLYGETSPNVLDVLEYLLDDAQADAWIVDRYAEKFGQLLRDWRRSHDVVRIASLTQQLPQGPRLLWEARRRLQYLGPPNPSEAQVATLELLRDIAREYAVANELEWDDPYF